MNILVIGNGFDLAHGLPTSYKEFLKFVLESADMCSRFQKNGLGDKESASAVAEIKEMIKDNFWINHFEKVSECGENWIDFETEISKVIQEIDAVRKLINEARRNPMEEAKYYREIENQYAGFSEKFSLDDVWDNPKGMQLVKENLLRDLNRLTHCLEIYLCQYVNKIEINGKEFEENSSGDGQYDAFVRALRKIYKVTLGRKFPMLTNYAVSIPPGGRTDAFVQTVITWSFEEKVFRTRGLDADQTEAAIKATMKMLNIIENEYE